MKGHLKILIWYCTFHLSFGNGKFQREVGSLKCCHCQMLLLKVSIGNFYHSQAFLIPLVKRSEWWQFPMLTFKCPPMKTFHNALDNGNILTIQLLAETFHFKVWMKSALCNFTVRPYPLLLPILKWWFTYYIISTLGNFYQTFAGLCSQSSSDMHFTWFFKKSSENCVKDTAPWTVWTPRRNSFTFSLISCCRTVLGIKNRYTLAYIRVPMQTCRNFLAK